MDVVLILTIGYLIPANINRFSYVDVSFFFSMLFTVKHHNSQITASFINTHRNEYHDFIAA